MYKSLVLIAICLFGFSAACKVSSTSFTTTDGRILFYNAFVTEFSLTSCENDNHNFPLYAEVLGKLSPVVRIGDKYQVSWSEDLKASSGDREVKIFDEEGYATAKKASRSGENTQNIKPLATLKVRHPGTSSDSFINSEIFATLAIAFVSYIAFSEMSQISKFHSSK